MLSVSRDAGAQDAWIHGVLAEVVEALAAIDRTPCSPGEQQAAEWIAARLRAAGASEVALEPEPSWGTFPPTATALAVLGALAASSVLAGRRASGALLAAVSMLGVVDEAQNGPRIVRRMLRRRRSTVNVVACAAREADHQEPYTLVVLAHHDAPQTGVIFDQTLQRRLYELAPSLLERGKTPLPQWWVGIAGPLLTIAAALGLGRGLARAGLSLNLLGSAVVADIWRSETVPGANDNLSGVAALVALAQLLRERP
ncbi:MAG: hypothetical protein QOI03_1256, partial [Solirubrobacteraceae bacterium]|nr:hypothetical protein [Solirubrobacteraceae bacterium]